jgi:hypothetical protein
MTFSRAPDGGRGEGETRRMSTRKTGSGVGQATSSGQDWDCITKSLTLNRCRVLLRRQKYGGAQSSLQTDSPEGPSTRLKNKQVRQPGKNGFCTGHVREKKREAAFSCQNDLVFFYSTLNPPPLLFLRQIATFIDSTSPPSHGQEAIRFHAKNQCPKGLF